MSALKTEIDLSGLNKFQSQLFGALLGTGQGGQGDAQRFIATEAGQLAWEISNQLGPKTKADGGKKIDADARKMFFTLQSKDGADVPVWTGAKAGSGEIQWLFASPKMKYIVGAEREDVHPRMGVSGLKEIARRSNRQRGAKWKDTGSNRGKYHVMLINRVVVGASAFKGFIKEQSQKVGLLRASFAYAASKLTPSKRIPGWIANHFADAAKGRAVFDPSKLHDIANPSVVFGSTAKGVTSNPYIKDKIARAVERRKKITADKMKKVIKGYTYNWNTGQVFRQVVPKEGIE